MTVNCTRMDDSRPSRLHTYQKDGVAAVEPVTPACWDDEGCCPVAEAGAEGSFPLPQVDQMSHFSDKPPVSDRCSTVLISADLVASILWDRLPGSTADGA